MIERLLWSLSGRQIIISTSVEGCCSEPILPKSLARPKKLTRSIRTTTAQSIRDFYFNRIMNSEYRKLDKIFCCRNGNGHPCFALEIKVIVGLAIYILETKAYKIVQTIKSIGYCNSQNENQDLKHLFNIMHGRVG